MHAFASDPPDLRVALVLGLGGGLRALAPAVALSIHDRGPFPGTEGRPVTETDEISDL